jgi:hypothetical protein
MVCMGNSLARAFCPSLGVLVDSPRFCMGLAQLLHPDDLHGLSNEKLQIGVRGIEVPHKVKYCGTLETERQEKQRKQIKPK